MIVVCAHSPKAAKPNQVPPSGETTGVTEDVATYEGMVKQHKSGEKPQPDQPAALPPLIPLLAHGAPVTDPLFTSCALALNKRKKQTIFKKFLIAKSNYL